MEMILGFLTGVFLTWLFFARKIDRDNSAIFRKIKDLEFENGYLIAERDIYKQTIHQWEQLEMDRLKQNVKQEKEQCQE